MIGQVLLALAFAWLIYSATCLSINIRRARTMGVPLVVVPISPMNVLWIVVEPLIFRLLDHLPIHLGTFGRYGRRGWHFHDKAQSHLELGDIFALVTPRETFVHLAQPDAILEVFSRRMDFIRPIQLYQMLDVFGPNVSTVGWTDWQRQRKVVSAPFNEKTNKLVWAESLNQARDMLTSWTRHGRHGTDGMAKDTRTLSLDVLATIGFHKSYRFRSHDEPIADEARNYRHSLATVLDNSLLMMLMPQRIFAWPFVPQSWAKIGQAITDFRNYMLEMLNKERSLIAEGKPGTGNLISSLVKASADHSKPASGAKTHANGPAGRTLSASEILGNIYVINFAGHDTTANTLAYAMLMLASYPDVQGWIGEEIRSVLGDQKSETWDYDTTFPKLKRCYAVLLETIRLYPPIMALPKSTSTSTQNLLVNDKIITVPADTMVVPSLLAVQTHSKYWKPDPLVWRPSRWIVPSSSASNQTGSSTIGLEQLFEPARGTYFPWSEGPQHCPGKKFAQVEFVAVLAHLFQSHRVHLHHAEGQTLDAAREHLLAVAEDSEHGLLLRMRRADDVRLVWEIAT